MESERVSFILAVNDLRRGKTLLFVRCARKMRKSEKARSEEIGKKRSCEESLSAH